MQEKKELDIGISKYSREKVIEHLKYSFTHDYLEQADFEKRCKIAINTQNRNDLKELVADLPEYKEEQSKPQEITSRININKGNIKDKSTIVSIFGGAERKGVWKPSKKLDIFVVMGGVDLSFTQAVFPPGVTEINVVCLLGGVDIIVPPGVNVINDCIAILGGVDDKSVQSENPDNPTLRITGFVFMGGLDIKPPRKKLMTRILKKLGLTLDDEQKR